LGKGKIDEGYAQGWELGIRGFAFGAVAQPKHGTASLMDLGVCG
jgi:hypothetical protein